MTVSPERLANAYDHACNANLGISSHEVAWLLARDDAYRASHPPETPSDYPAEGVNAWAKDEEPKLARSKYCNGYYSYWAGAEWNRLDYVPDECLLEIARHIEWRQRQQQAKTPEVTDEMCDAFRAEKKRQCMYDEFGHYELRTCIAAALAAQQKGK